MLSKPCGQLKVRVGGEGHDPSMLVSVMVHHKHESRVYQLFLAVEKWKLEVEVQSPKLSNQIHRRLKSFRCAQFVNISLSKSFCRSIMPFLIDGVN